MIEARFEARVEALFERLGLAPHNPAASSGDGHWLEGTRRFASVNPASGLALAEVGCATAHEYDAVLAAARAAFLRWREKPAPARGLFVRDLAEELRRHKDDLGTLIALEVGKIKAEGDGEVQEMIDIADFAVGLSRQLYGLTLASERPRHRMMEQWHPLGVVGVVTAFNFPGAVWAWNACLAAVCGDATVWRPSPKAPLSAIAVQHLVERVAARHDAQGVCSLLLSDTPELVERLAADTDVALLSFTGSSAVGRKLAQSVAGRYGRSLLECSGNNAVIVDATADLDLATAAIFFGALGTAGQRCTTTRRLIVHEFHAQELTDRLAQAYAQAKIGDPLDAATLMGPLIDEAAVRAYLAAVAKTAALGGTIVCGGKRIARPGFFVEPTLIRAENAWAPVQRETFAPILYAMRYRDFDEALALHNAVPQGLSSALFTLDQRHAERFVSATGSDCGIANVNLGTSGAEIGGAFGGEKETGGGREAGSDAWKAYMRRQTNTVNWGSELPLAQGIRFDLD